ncbi:class I SAM-dependent methyltransferase [Ruegeria sp. HKCCD7221]|uniref:class I SAM-dependent methyltransferase n=1 Tax=Ruegeria sp. HKCCD7221 TaxID=2683009 RepID=UPI0014887906|nr:class I SAM-dependent methyltransferase [Ruegeria sp. HKCCD7221]
MARAQLREKIIEKMAPKEGTIAEIGVFKGAFSEKLLKLTNPKKLFLVDPWQNLDDTGVKNSWYHAESSNDMPAIYEGVCGRFEEQIEAGQVEVLRGTSKELAAAIPDGALDFAYIDGDHRFHGVLEDLNFLSPKIRIKGMIMLDDHVLGRWWDDGVVRALNTFLGENAASWQIARAVGNQVVVRRHR